MYRKYWIYNRKQRGVKIIVSIALALVLLYVSAVYATARLEIDESNIGDVSLEVFSEYEIPKPSAAIKLPLFFNKEIKTEVVSNVTIETDKLGNYKIEYKSEFLKKSGFEAQIVSVVDTTPPEIEISEREFLIDADKRPITADMVDINYSVWDNCDGDITAKTEKKIENDFCLFTATDSSGNIGNEKVKIVYVDKKAPQIKLKGNSTIYLPINTPYKELGYTVTDNYDKNIASKLFATNNININKNGTYSVTYSVTDSSGNIASAERRVIVYGGGYDESYDTVKPNGKVIYLTFDDGPSIYTERLLNTLKKYKIKATFFVTNQKPKYQNLITQMANDGHTVAVHTYSHKWEIYKSVEAYMADFNAMNKIIENRTGKPTRIFRFPGGTNNTVSKSHCEGIMTTLSKQMLDSGYTYFDWNVSSGDTHITDPSSMISYLTEQVQNKRISVILAHDIKKATVDAMPGFIEYCLKRGYSFKAITNATEPIRFSPKN